MVLTPRSSLLVLVLYWTAVAVYGWECSATLDPIRIINNVWRAANGLFPGA